MKNTSLIAVSTALLVSFAFNSCDTPTGQGAAIGAGAGALLAGAGHHGHHGHHGGNVLAGAAIGAAAGALIGAAVEQDRHGYYDGRPVGYYPWGRRTGTRGFVYSPYPPHNIVDVRGIPSGELVRDPSTGRIFRRP
jgi:hypothetical protein